LLVDVEQARAPPLCEPARVATHVRAVLEGLEAGMGEAPEQAAPALAFLAAPGVSIDEGELRAARRRAMLLLAAGGDPRRGLDLDGRAVRALAADLDRPERRAQLRSGLAALRAAPEGLPRVSETLQALLRDEELAWRALACALLAEELADEGVPARG
jgi:hypothetical protein